MCALELNPEELARSLSRGTTWDPVKAGPLAGQVSFFGIYDGHGGRQVSQFLQHKLAALVESVTPADIQPVVESTVELGGYFRRWRGGPLRRFTEWTLGERAGENDLLTIEERLTLAFLKVGTAGFCHWRVLTGRLRRTWKSAPRLSRLNTADRQPRSSWYTHSTRPPSPTGLPSGCT